MQVDKSSGQVSIPEHGLCARSVRAKLRVKGWVEAAAFGGELVTPSTCAHVIASRRLQPPYRPSVLVSGIHIAGDAVCIFAGEHFPVLKKATIHLVHLFGHDAVSPLALKASPSTLQ